MQVEVYKPSRRAILRSEAFASTLYGKACHEKWKDMRHRALEYRIQHDPAFKLTPEQEVEHPCRWGPRGLPHASGPGEAAGPSLGGGPGGEDCLGLPGTAVVPQCCPQTPPELEAQPEVC